MNPILFVFVWIVQVKIDAHDPWSRYDYGARTDDVAVPIPVDDSRGVYVDLPSASIRSGESTTINCISHYPAIQYTWILTAKGGREQVVGRSAQLQIDSKGMSGPTRYTCKVQLADGTDQEASSDIMIVVDESEQPSDEISIDQPNRSERAGSRVQFNCIAGYPSHVKVTWLRRGSDRGLSPIGYEWSLILNNVQSKDSGEYVCRAEFPDGRTSHQKAYLYVDDSPAGIPELPGSIQREIKRCEDHEATCGDGSCIRSSFRCDGKEDCPDGSDEKGCGVSGSNDGECHPDQFLCPGTEKCIQKIWLCDGDADCPDGSDENPLHCEYTPTHPSSVCKPSEYQCASRNVTQCIPRSYVCDESVDCPDRSDEFDCVKPTVINPPAREKVVVKGNDLVLSCTARGNPVPFINWRLNWGFICGDGHGNGRCIIQHQRNSNDPDVITGILTVKNAQGKDAGAYSCEAINSKGFDFAIPDAFVRISEHQEEMKCHRAGTLVEENEECQCKMNAAGRNCNECKPGYYYLAEDNVHGCVSCFCSGVSKHCVSDASRRETLIYELVDTNPSWQIVHMDYPKQPWVHSVNIIQHPGSSSLTFNSFDMAPPGDLYWAAMDTSQYPFGDLIRAYGGNLILTIQEQLDMLQLPRKEPLVWLRGNEIDMIYRVDRIPPARDGLITFEIKMTENSFTRLDGSPIDRPYMMMGLANVDKFLVRAGLHPRRIGPVGLVSITMEITSPRGSGKPGPEVEKCTCPRQYSGTSCELCADGYTKREGVGLYLGECYSCSEHCNQMTDRCDSVTGQCMNCINNTVGQRCEQCSNGFRKNPSTGQCEYPGHVQTATLPESPELHTSVPAMPTVMVDEQIYESTRSIVVIVRPQERKVVRVTSVDPGLLPSSVWLRVEQGGMRVPLPVGMVQVGNDLLIENPRPEMVGKYEVILRFVNGQVVTPNIQLEYADEFHPTIEPQGVVRKFLNEQVVITINVHNYPIRSISWTKDGSTLPSSIINVKSNEIIIQSLSAELCGTYQAHVYAERESEPKVLSTTVECVGHDWQRPDVAGMGLPKITLTPSIVNLVDGQTMVVTYDIVGEQPVDLQWRKQMGYDWVALPPSFYVRHDQLILNYSQPSDTGVYMVEASNRYGKDQAILQLFVDSVRPGHSAIPEPEVRFANTLWEIKLHDRVRIQPDIQTSEAYTVTWSLANGGPLPHGARVDGDALVIDDMTNDLAGSYQIEVSTSTANVRVPVDIELIDQPPMAMLPVKAEIDGPANRFVGEGTDVRLSCFVTGSPNQGHQYVIKWTRDKEMPLPETAYEQRGELYIRSFRNQDEGAYTCSATDTYGNVLHQNRIHISIQQVSVLSWIPGQVVYTFEGSPVRAQCVGAEPNMLQIITDQRGQRIARPNWVDFIDGNLYISKATSSMDGMRIVCQAHGVDNNMESELTIRVRPERTSDQQPQDGGGYGESKVAVDTRQYEKGRSQQINDHDTDDNRQSGSSANRNDIYGGGRQMYQKPLGAAPPMQQPQERLEVTLPSQVTVEASSSFEIKCSVNLENTRNLIFTWKKHGREGVESLPHHIHASHDILRGTNVKQSDYAYYMCKVENRATSEEAAAYTLLDVQSKQHQ